MAGNQDMRTPPEFWDVLYAEFHFHIDVAASNNNNMCARWYTAEDDALSDQRSWVAVYGYSAYCNPPFRTPGMMPWVVKAYAETLLVPGTTVVVIGPNSGAEWMAFCERHAVEIRNLSPRVQWINPDGSRSGNNMHDNVAVVFRYKPVGRGPAVRYTWYWQEEMKRMETDADE